MTGKERLLLAFRNKQPDIVPIAPDIDLIGMHHSRTHSVPTVGNGMLPNDFTLPA